jgi:hypothetical protein
VCTNPSTFLDYDDANWAEGCYNPNDDKIYVRDGGSAVVAGCVTDYTDLKVNGSLVHADPTLIDIVGASVSGSNPTGSETQVNIKSNYILYTDWTNNQVTGTTATTTTKTYTLSGGTLSSSDGLRIRAGFNGTTQGATNTWFYIYFGGTKICEQPRTNANNLVLSCEVFNTGATNTQEFFEIQGYSFASLGTAAVDTTANVAIEVKINPGATTDDWTNTFLTIEYLDN